MYTSTPIKSIVVLLLGIFLLTSHTNAQMLERERTSTLQKKSVLKKADQLFEKGHYYTAAKLYGQYLSEHEHPDDNLVKYKLATANRHGRFYEFSALWYRDVAEKSDDFPLALYWLGMMQKANHDYEAARQSFEAFSLNYKGSEEKYLNRASEEVGSFEKLASMYSYPLDVKLTKMEGTVNSPNSDIGAVMLGNDKIVLAKTDYMEVNERSLLAQRGSDRSMRHLTRLYQIKRTDGDWTNKSKIQLLLKDENCNVGSPAFSQDEKLMLFTVCKDQYGMEACNIYYSFYEDCAWLAPKKLPAPITVEGANNKHPMIVTTPDGQHILFFASDREGGYGKLDIWYSVMQKNSPLTFENPVNAGPVVNTDEDEVTPFYNHSDGILYFSSNGRAGFGEMDVFKAYGNVDKGWHSPTNLGVPVNSSADDYYFTHYKKENGESYGLLSSNRKGGHQLDMHTCCDNIYQYEGNISNQNYQVKGILYDQDGKNLIIEATVKLYRKGTEQPISTKAYSKQYNMSFFYPEGENYYLKVLKEGYYPRIIDLEAPLSNSNSSLKTSRIENVKKQIDITLSRVALANIYFDFNDTQLSSVAKLKLTNVAEVLKSNHSLKLLIQAHTDNIDNKWYNLSLSEKRTTSIMNELERLDIDAAQCIRQWYGESVPYASNQLEDGSDNPAGRQLNRRAELIMVLKTDQITSGPMIDYSIEDYDPEFDQRLNTGLSAHKTSDKPSLDSETYQLMVQKYGIMIDSSLQFRVQVGAFNQSVEPMLITQLRDSVHIEKVHNGEGLIRYLGGQAIYSLEAADKLRAKMVELGIRDAFVVPYYKNKRIYMTDAIEILGDKNRRTTEKRAMLID